jgi:hypothetical protein
LYRVGLLITFVRQDFSDIMLAAKVDGIPGISGHHYPGKGPASGPGPGVGGEAVWITTRDGVPLFFPIVDHLPIADDRDTRLDNIGLLLITHRYRVTSKGETGGSHS